MSEWRVCFKKVAHVGNRYYSIFAGEAFEFAIGTEISQPAVFGHSGGFFVYCTLPEAEHADIAFREGGFFGARQVVLECLCRGPYVRYGRKIACSYLYAVREVARVALNTQPRDRSPTRLRPPTSSSLPGVPMREQTRQLEEEVRALERRLGYA